jgi:hypothetical protein
MSLVQRSKRGQKMEITQLYDSYNEGRVRHFKPKRTPGNHYVIEIQVLDRMADDSGFFWRNSSVKNDGNIMCFSSESGALDALAAAGLFEAYEARFDHRDGYSVLRW